MLRIAEFALLADRLLLAFVFLLAGATKLADPMGWRKAWREFGLPDALAPAAVLLLPVLELTVGAALLPAALAWYGAWGSLALLTAFLMVMAIAMVRGRKPDCQCFGQLRPKPVGWSTVLRDVGLAGCAGRLVTRGRFGAGPAIWDWFGTLGTDGRKLAVIAACAAGFLFFRLLNCARPSTETTESEEPEEIDFEPVQPQRPAARRRPPVEHRPPGEHGAPQEQSSSVTTGARGIGLAVGTPAPDFELPSITGEKHSMKSLWEQGKDVVLVFSSPFCEPCRTLAPKLARWSREMDGTVNFVVVSRGSARDNVAKLSGFEASRVLLQREAEISEAYDCTATPSAVVVGADGRIRSELVVGGAAIQQLVSTCAERASDRVAGSDNGGSGTTGPARP